MDRDDLSGFIAYIPCYEEGNSVRAIDRDARAVLINKSIKAVIAGLLKESNINIKFLRKNFNQYIGSINLMPIPLKLGTVLIPVKMRKTIGVNDGAYGYLDLSHIAEVGEDEGTFIKLKCGTSINCLETVKTVKDRMHKGKLMEEKYTSHVLAGYSFKEGLTNISSEYDRAATKGDITMLAYEIMKLRNEIK